MGNDDTDKCIFPLTSLQIGDLQSYLSDISLFLASDSKHFYILVDNRPWLRDLVSRPAQFWQLMVTKSRLSPFANKARKGSKELGKLSDFKYDSKPNSAEPDKYKRWFSLVDAASQSRKRALLPVKKLRNSLLLSSELHRTLYGFIVFEVSCANVRGINYVNELQTHTSLAIESKIMKRWEFDSIAQAATCISSWFSGTKNEQLLLKDYLTNAAEEVFYDAEEGFSTATSLDDRENTLIDDVVFHENSPVNSGGEFSGFPESKDEGKKRMHTPCPPTESNKRRKISTSNITRDDLGIFLEESAKVDSAAHSAHTPVKGECENTIEPVEYRDV